MMKLQVIDDYKSIYPDLSGQELTDALIRDCFGQEDIVIRRTEKGKPCITDPHAACKEESPCHISVSHSEGTFALLRSECNAGLDIQYARNIDTGRIAARFFTAEEAEYASADPSGGSFFVLWTRKEALCKYTGMGMEQIMRKDPVLSEENVRFMDLRLDNGCFCCICTGREGGCEPDEIQISYRK